MIAPVDTGPQMPADLREILDSDPRLAGLRNKPGELSRPVRVLEPKNPPSAGEHEFVRLNLVADDPVGVVEWVNEPRGAFLSVRAGYGLGLKPITQTPEFREKGSRLEHRADAYTYNTWMIASNAFVEVVRQFAPDAIETLPVDWWFEDGGRLDGIHFLDVTRRVDVYDYHRSKIRVMSDRGVRSLEGLDYPRAVKPGVDAGVTICRDAYMRSDILVSRTLAHALARAGLRGVRFEELLTGRTMKLDSAD